MSGFIQGFFVILSELFEKLSHIQISENGVVKENKPLADELDNVVILFPMSDVVLALNDGQQKFCDAERQKKVNEVIELLENIRSNMFVDAFGQDFITYSGDIKSRVFVIPDQNGSTFPAIIQTKAFFETFDTLRNGVKIDVSGNGLCFLNCILHRLFEEQHLRDGGFSAFEFYSEVVVNRCGLELGKNDYPADSLGRATLDSMKYFFSYIDAVIIVVREEVSQGSRPAFSIELYETDIDCERNYIYLIHNTTNHFSLITLDKELLFSFYYKLKSYFKSDTEVRIVCDDFDLHISKRH